MDYLKNNQTVGQKMRQAQVLLTEGQALLRQKAETFVQLPQECGRLKGLAEEIEKVSARLEELIIALGHGV